MKMTIFGGGIYYAPSVERLTVTAENGFAASPDYDYDVKSPNIGFEWDSDDEDTYA